MLKLVRWQWFILICIPIAAVILAGCPWSDETGEGLDDYGTGASDVLAGVVQGVGSWELIPPWLSPGGRGLPPVGTPLVAVRESHSMVWTTPGAPRFIIWGGRGNGGYLSSGAIWRQDTRVWSATPAAWAGGLPARIGHTAVWTGSEKIIFGGRNSSGTILNSGAMYDPAGNTWIYMSPPSWVYTRVGHTANWTGTRMLVFGGWGNSVQIYWWWWTPTPPTFLGNLQVFNPTLNTWTAGSISSEPSPRWYHTAVWTDTELIVWGGSNQSYLNNGKRYNYATDSWSEMSLVRAPAGREGHTAVYTDSVDRITLRQEPWNKKMIVWGGGNPQAMNSGGIYDIDLDQWLTVQQDGSTIAADKLTTPISRTNHTAVWTGRRMIVWGGTDQSNNILNTGGIYDPLTDTWQATQNINAPTARRRHTAVWTGTQMIIFGGYSGEAYLSDAYIYTPPAR